MKLDSSFVKCPLCDSSDGFCLILDVPREIRNGFLISFQYVSTVGPLYELLKIRNDKSHLSEVIETRVGRGTRVVCETCNINDTISEMPLELDTIIDSAV